MQYRAHATLFFIAYSLIAVVCKCFDRHGPMAYPINTYNNVLGQFTSFVFQSLNDCIMDVDSEPILITASDETLTSKMQ